jgi:hypothetical protein
VARAGEPPQSSGTQRPAGVIWIRVCESLYVNADSTSVGPESGNMPGERVSHTPAIRTSSRLIYVRKSSALVCVINGVVFVMPLLLASDFAVSPRG